MWREMAATRLTSRRFVGRREALDDLTAALQDAEAGEPRIAFVAGESGVGKTRLVTEFLAARAGAARVLLGQSAAGLGADLPFSPLRSALRTPLRDGDPELAEVTGTAGPDLTTLLSDLPRGASAREGHRLEDVEQGRTFEALLDVFERLSRSRPLLLVLEDLHWADRSTRDFLIFLAGNLRDAPLMVLGTYRTDELYRRHPLLPMLAELERSWLTRRITLDRFTQAELAEQLSDLLGSEPEAELVQRLWGRSSGNPLFTEELLAAGADGDGPLPESLRHALMVRIDSLSANAQVVLRAVAVGHALDEEALSAATSLDVATVREALREAMARQVLVVHRDGSRYQFRHELLREAVADDLLPGEAADLNLAIADLLAERDSPCSATVAQHYVDAGCATHAMPWLVKAADEAEDVHAFGEAAEWWELAASLGERLARENGEDLLNRVELLTRAAEANQAAGAGRRARDLLRRALEDVDADADPELASDLHLRIAQANWTIADGDGALAAYQQAIAYTSPEKATPARARALAWSAKILMLRGRLRESVDRAEQAIEAARATGLARVEGGALNSRGLSLTIMGYGEEGIASLSESLVRAEGCWDDSMRAYANRAEALHILGRIQDALAVAREGLHATAVAGREAPWVSLMAAEILFELGEWPEARERIFAERPGGKGAGFRFFHAGLGAELNLADGHTEAAWKRLEPAIERSRSSRDVQWHALLGTLAGETLRRARRFDAARQALDHALQRFAPPKGHPIEDVLRFAQLAATTAAVEADAAEEAEVLGHAEEAVAARDRAGERVDAVREAIAARERPAPPAALAHLAVAEAELARARGASDAELWERAADLWRDLRRPYRAALAAWRQAEAMVEHGDRPGAAVVLREAATVAEHLGARWLATEIAALAGQARIPLEGEEQPAAAPEPLADELGLTPRERQVLALVAQGATNREIGEQLYMAEKTASVHVSRILAKLDVRSRTQAAAVAHRLGLVAETMSASS
jgi:DNA-binding NarL/FixJ family response regulator